MTKITGFNRNTTAAFRSDLNAVLAKYGLESGLEFKIGTIRFSATDVRMQVEAKIKGAASAEDRAISNLMASYNLREVGNGGERLVGYNSRAYAYPVIYSRGGKRYKTSIENAKRIFAK